MPAKIIKMTGISTRISENKAAGKFLYSGLQVKRPFLLFSNDIKYLRCFFSKNFK